MKKKQNNLLLKFFLIFAVLGISFTIFYDYQNDIKKSLATRELPNFVLPTFPNQDEKIAKDAFYGRYSLINVFASWCIVCRIEHELFLELQEHYDLNFVGLNWKDETQDLQEWLAENGNPYKEIIYDKDGELVVKLGVHGVPESFLVDPSGKIIFSYAGALTEDIFNEFIAPLLPHE